MFQKVYVLGNIQTIKLPTFFINDNNLKIFPFCNWQEKRNILLNSQQQIANHIPVLLRSQANIAEKKYKFSMIKKTDTDVPKRRFFFHIKEKVILILYKAIWDTRRRRTWMIKRAILFKNYQISHFKVDLSFGISVKKQIISLMKFCFWINVVDFQEHFKGHYNNYYTL